jgi:YggT family protein
MVIALFDILIMLLNVLWWIIIIQVILSWLFAFNVLNVSSQGVRAFAGALEKITAPIYRPIRKILRLLAGVAADIAIS